MRRLIINAEVMGDEWIEIESEESQTMRENAIHGFGFVFEYETWNCVVTEVSLNQGSAEVRNQLFIPLISWKS